MEQIVIQSATGTCYAKETYKVEEILPLIGKGMPPVLLDGDKVPSNTRRLRCFKAHGIRCASCGLEAAFFRKERHYSSKTYHLNLYGINDIGMEIVFTADHILPRSKGGKDHEDNLQTMCEPCNQRKGNGSKQQKVHQVFSKSGRVSREFTRAMMFCLDYKLDSMKSENGWVSFRELFCNVRVLSPEKFRIIREEDMVQILRRKCVKRVVEYDEINERVRKVILDMPSIVDACQCVEPPKFLYSWTRDYTIKAWLAGGIRATFPKYLSLFERDKDGKVDGKDFYRKQAVWVRIRAQEAYEAGSKFFMTPTGARWLTESIPPQFLEMKGPIIRPRPTNTYQVIARGLAERFEAHEQ